MIVLVDFSFQTGDALIKINVDNSSLPEQEIRSVLDELKSILLPFLFVNNACKLPWADYLQIASRIRFSLIGTGVQLLYAPEADRRIRRWVYESKIAGGNIDLLPDNDKNKTDQNLHETAWNFANRTLTSEQLRDLSKMSRLPNAANFSVPGAGKTTVALANHLLWALNESSPKLLIVAPKNAFPAWDEALSLCLLKSEPLIRLTGGSQHIQSLFHLSPRFAIISYTQLINAEESTKRFLLRNNVHLIVDESHRMKSGLRGLAPAALIRLAPYAVRRDILSGTPAPQAPSDLEPQMKFMYPATTIANRISSVGPKTAIGHLYVRTTQNELGLKPSVQTWSTSSMTDSQRLLYAVIADETIQQLIAPSPGMRIMKYAVMRLLQAAIDPIGVSKTLLQSGQSNQKLVAICEDVVEENQPQRLLDAITLAENVIQSGRKVVLWAPFSHAIKTLAQLAEPLGSSIINGDTPSGDEDEPGTRENIVKRFHLDDDLKILVANPAAGGEGISLHRACQDAIFVGRTYNQAHYLQARDRTNRLGMPPNSVARETIIELTTPVGIGSIDLSVRRRLQVKISDMASVLNDDDLKQLVLDSDEQDQFLDDGTDLDDIHDLVNQLRNGI